MKRKPRQPLLPSASTVQDTCSHARLRWWRTRRYRKLAAVHLLRGLAYGTGTGIAGLTVYWIQQHL